MRDPGTFADLLRGHRIASGLSQEELAQRARLSLESIGALERGVRRAPYRPTVDQLSEALGLSPDDRAAFERAAASARVRSVSRKRDQHLLPAHNLPAPQSSFVGRKDDVEKLAGLFRTHRLVTLTGSGGVGKTRVAVEVGNVTSIEGPMEVAFIDLGSLQSGSFVAEKIASSLEPPLAGRFETVAKLAAELTTRRALLILDNCEHIVDQAAAVANQLLEKCPGISILATSRERLNIAGETVYRLPSLSVPSHWPRSRDEARTYGALALFMDRAESAGSSRSEIDASLEKMIEVCRGLDGIPLAIEIVAARVPLLGMPALADRLTERLASWRGSREQPTRQQTMLATIEWSYALLARAEQVLLRRLAVFFGGFTLAAVESVCSDALLDPEVVAERLAALVEKSLVTANHDPSGIRYRLLEPLRAFALAKLDEAGEATDVARGHALWVASLAQSLRPASIAEWTKAHAASAELDNARAALAWVKSASLPEDRAIGPKIFLGLTGLWTLTGRHAESERIARELLAGIDETQYPLDAALLTGHVVARSWARPGSRRDIELAIERFERLGQPATLSQCYTMLTYVYARLGELAKSESAAERAMQLAIEANVIDTLPYGDIFASRSQLRCAQERFDDARADLAEASRIATALGSHFFLAALCVPRLAHIELKAGDFDRALSLVREMLASDVTSIKEMITLEAYGFLACIRLHLGDLSEAELAARKQLELARGDESMALEYFATVAALRGDALKGARLNGFVRALLAEEPLLGFSYQRTDRLLQAALREQLSANEIASQGEIGSQLSVSQAVAEALS